MLWLDLQALEADSWFKRLYFYLLGDLGKLLNLSVHHLYNEAIIILQHKVVVRVK